MKLGLCFAQVLILLTQLTAFKAFETYKKLNSVCCNYLHFSRQSLVMTLKKKFPSLLSNNSQAIHKDQIFDDEIDRKCCVKKLLRFLTNNI